MNNLFIYTKWNWLKMYGICDLLYWYKDQLLENVFKWIINSKGLVFCEVSYKKQDICNDIHVALFAFQVSLNVVVGSNDYYFSLYIVSDSYLNKASAVSVLNRYRLWIVSYVKLESGLFSQNVWSQFISTKYCVLTRAV